MNISLGLIRKGMQRFVRSSFPSGLKSLKEATQKVAKNSRTLKQDNKIPAYIINLRGGETVYQYKSQACEYILLADDKADKKIAR